MTSASVTPSVHSFVSGSKRPRRWSALHRITGTARSSGFETVSTFGTPDLVCSVEIERYRAKVGGREDLAPVELRVTSVFRLEGGAWKIVPRHADPITTPQPV